MAGPFAMTLMIALGSVHAESATGVGWKQVYRDNFNYSAQTATFNTWFWREDSSATHSFDVVTPDDQCSAAAPCVKLTAQASPENTAYVNAEMYNNSCPHKGDNSLAPLTKTAWGRSLYGQIVFNCDLPYPYHAIDPLIPPPNPAPAGVTDSWISEASPAPHLNENTLAFTAFDAEAPRKAVRDAAFNNPFSLRRSLAIRTTAAIKAETKDQGGSRGWGFWNTTMNPADMQLAWFMEYSQPGRGAERNVFAQTIGKDGRGNWSFCQTRLSETDANAIYDGFHQYSITLFSKAVSARKAMSAVTYYIDGRQVATHLLKIDKPMAFHNWVDNRDYEHSQPANYPLTHDKSNYIRSFVVDRIAEGTGDSLKSVPMAQSGVTSCWEFGNLKFSSLDDILKYAVKKHYETVQKQTQLESIPK